MATATQGGELPESRLYTFLDRPAQFAIYFLEGQRLIHDLALMHPIRGRGFAYYRDVLLSVQPMIALLKSGEQLGFYIDSEIPWFRLKIETSWHGATRSMLLPEQFAEFPEAMTGLVRVLKAYTDGRPPYQSVIKAESLPLRELVNRVLRESYQAPAVSVVSQVSDQSLLLHQLPPQGGMAYDDSLSAARQRREELEESMQEIFSRALHDSEPLSAALAESGFRLIGERTVRFRCSCSRERMIANLRTVCGEETGELFDPGQIFVEVVCEYCKRGYSIGRDEL
jgi:molecular chaperone Hsp33